MKIKPDFALLEIADDLLLVPAGQTAPDLNAMMILNEAGGEVWKLLPEAADEEELISRLLEECDVQEEVLRKDVDCFLNELRTLNIL